MSFVEQRIVSGAPAALVWQGVGNDGEPFDPGVVSAEIVLQDGSSAAAVASGEGVGPRGVVLSAAQTSQLGPLSVSWSAGGVEVGRSVAEVVGGLYFSNAQLRAAEQSVSDATKFPASLVAIARQQVEARIERWTGRAFVPRFKRVRVQRGANGLVALPGYDVRAVRSIVGADGLVPLEGVEVVAGGLRVPGLSGSALAGVEYGLDAPPADLRAAAMRLCREVLARSKGGGLPENAISYTSTEAGWSAVLVTPGVRGAFTAIPEVNEVVGGYVLDEALIA